ncbi:MAG TPA: prepilin-type N-terminal cleavage/methylation domain-containing protein [Candidatus Acidoferrales bacterium]|nr:prepilin-type N-terminal cleavage/methylation domain-containing protein [Candidatus Acidoferrales bacterium]
MKLRARRSGESGFTLIETMIAMIVLTVGILALAAMLGSGLAYMTTSQYDYIAQQKAAEAVESVFEARDIGQATWSTICNVGSSVCCAGVTGCTAAGIFLNGANPLCGAGADGIVGTADDFNGASCAGGALAAPDAILLTNNNGTLNPPVSVPLSTFSRTITISTVTDGSGNTINNLRQITVTINYSAGPFKNRSYRLNAYISNFS